MASRRRTERIAVPVAAVAAALLLGGCATLADLAPSAAGAGSSPTAGPPVSAPGSAAPSAPTPTSPSVRTPPTALPGPRATAAAAPAPSATSTATSTPSPVPSETSAPAQTATPKPTPKPTQKPKPKPKPTQKPKPKPTQTPEPQRKLVRGDQGKDVLLVQQRLSELGYWLGEADGSFGHLTQQSVWALQKSAGISRDGVVGPRTRKALADGIRPRATLNGNGVEIDLERQVLLVVRGGKVRTVLNTSTGNGEEYTSTKGHQARATTPKGTFAVYRGVDGPLTNSLGELWRPRFFHRGIAVHGSPNIPPFAASHGCARLSNAAIDMIWAKDLMPIGATVVVR